ncbi:hypothetical protein DMH02_011910 [Streptomyces sp. WAC 00631]|uniref:hypothetical protein n=1 Tax=Streptomyces sp. WAC 00631 TaxID=2203201 RepID=UPI000F791452|nr:hypothetical protein [Streptomyces sp. WAC 00631]MCC5033911.1 hypothetical protein [Streptomyces sp. WAC 00631]
MAVLVLSGILVLVAGGCVCVVWAARGGPRWVRAVAGVTLAVAQVVSLLGRSGRRSSLGGGGGSDD